MSEVVLSETTETKDAPLATELCGIKMRTPILAASGTFGFGEEFADFVDLRRLGAVVVKGLTLKARRGNDGVRVAETAGGMLNSIGLENPGVDVFLKEILPRITKYDMNVIANISGGTVEEYGRLAEKLDVPLVAAVEVNISCPNVKEGGIAFGTNPASAQAVTREVKSRTKKPVIVKLSPNACDIAAMAKACEDAGADAISLVNTLTGMQIDTRTWRPALGNVTGGLSGPCIKPIALRMVYEAARVCRVPIVGMGGIASANDAVEFFLAGASAVAVGTANFIDPRTTMNIADGLLSYLKEKKLGGIKELVGKVKV